MHLWAVKMRVASIATVLQYKCAERFWVTLSPELSGMYQVKDKTVLFIVGLP